MMRESISGYVKSGSDELSDLVLLLNSMTVFQQVNAHTEYNLTADCMLSFSS